MHDFPECLPGGGINSLMARLPLTTALYLDRMIDFPEPGASPGVAPLAMLFDGEVMESHAPRHQVGYVTHSSMPLPKNDLVVIDVEIRLLDYHPPSSFVYVAATQGRLHAKAVMVPRKSGSGFELGAVWLAVVQSVPYHPPAYAPPISLGKVSGDELATLAKLLKVPKSLLEPLPKEEQKELFYKATADYGTPTFTNWWPTHKPPRKKREKVERIEQSFFYSLPDGERLIRLPKKRED